jgi:carbonic anhydrase/acetyltransferase-like protein (isoleucine patch superfamily)
MSEPYLDFEPTVDATAFVHPSAVLIGEVEVGPGASVWPTAVLRGDCGKLSIGSHSNIQDGCVVHATRDVSVTQVGERVTVGHRAVLHGCRIGDDCLIGMGAIVLDNAVIGAGSIVGAGSVVLAGSKFAPRSLILGSPAKRVKEIGAAKLAWIDSSWRAYSKLVAQHRG